MKLHFGHSRKNAGASSMPRADQRFASIRQADAMMGDIGNDKVSFSGSCKPKKHPLAALKEKILGHHHKSNQDDMMI